MFWAMGGWKIEGELPKDIHKYVIAVAHHTSNWDFPLGVAFKFVTRIEIRYFAKHSLFFWPLGVVMRTFGGLPIERTKSGNRVQQMADQITASDHFILAIAPEGTRSKVQRWKTGFYHIAKTAGVPIIPIAFNYRDKVVAVGEPMMPSDDMKQDLLSLHHFFADRPGKFPELGCNDPIDHPELYD